MREKTHKLVITFSTTSAAMAMEAVCGQENGRLIPLPSEISGGCGLAWCANPKLEEMLLIRMQENNISYDEKRILLLY